MTPRFCSLAGWWEYVEACADYGWQEMLLAYPARLGHCCKCAQQIDTHPLMWILAQQTMPRQAMGFGARIVASIGHILIIAISVEHAPMAKAQRVQLASGQHLVRYRRPFRFRARVPISSDAHSS